MVASVSAMPGHRFSLGAGIVPGVLAPLEPRVAADSDAFGRANALQVKEAMAHAWSGYKNRAWGFDALKPISGRGENPWGGIGCTLVDSLDTLWLMGMKVSGEARGCGECSCFTGLLRFQPT